MTMSERLSVVRKGQREYFAEWLNRTMANRQLTGAEVAQGIGAADSAVSRWKNGKGLPTTELCVNLAKFLGVHPIGLMITAGQIQDNYEQDGVTYTRLPLPEDSARHAQVREQILRLRGVSAEDKEAMFALWERRQKDDSTGVRE